MTGSLPNVFCNIVKCSGMFVFQVCFCDIDGEEGSRTLTILQKTFGKQKQTWKTNMTGSLPNVFCNIVNVLEPSSSSISQKHTWKTNMTRSLPNVFCNIVNVPCHVCFSGVFLWCRWGRRFQNTNNITEDIR
jgi:hypothetical protein